MDFKKISNEYRPIPFWSWNEKLDTEETRRQVRLMKEAGIGGYFMHARGGLLTEYMGEEWFDNVTAAVEEGERVGMDSWAYDENGWPSGFGDGKVLECGEDYQIKNLTYIKTENYTGAPERVLLVRDGYTYYYNVNPLYVDLLNPAVTDKFIEVAYEPYRIRYGKRITGFFTDEPQLLRAVGYPWSIITRDEFMRAYGYDLVESVPSLFFEVGDYKKVRFDYWKLTTELFSKNYFKRLYDWCDKWGYKLTGHLVCEDVMDSLVPPNGACMPHYEYFHVPGMDWLGRPLLEISLTEKQLGSAAAQLGKKQVLSETFALTGHNVSHAELKRIFEWQMVNGVNLLCTHLEGYSNRGIRKRDYPAAIYYQQPWWDDVKIFFDTVSRIGNLLGEGEETADTLLIHTLSSSWVLYDGFVENRKAAEKMREVSDALAKDMRTLERKHILYHLGDETLMERHGRVEGKELVIGKMKYSRVIIPEHTVFFENTERLLREFREAGGEITTVEAIRENPITGQNDLTYAMRTYDDFKLHYFVNSTEKSVSAVFNRGDLVLDPVSGETSPFSGFYTFAPYESLVLIESGAYRLLLPNKKEERELSLLGDWDIESQSLNSITLDRCDYSFDGELIAERGYVLDILPRINAYRRPVKLWQKYRFAVEEIPEGEVYLVTETPEIFDIKVNGKPLVKRDMGDFVDISFRKLPISEYLVTGENTIEFESTISQSEKTYKHIDNSWEFETMTNCLSYDIEIEPIYIAGNFGVKITAPTEELCRDAYRVKELQVEGGSSFAITKAPKCVDISRIDTSGYPEFAGTLTLKRSFKLDKDGAYRVKLCGRGMNAVSIKVNGEQLGTKMFPPYYISLTDSLSKSKNGELEIELTIRNNLRNMQGPHHHKDGEITTVNRNVFYRESCVFNHARGADDTCHDILRYWDDGVVLVHFGF